MVFMNLVSILLIFLIQGNGLDDLNVSRHCVDNYCIPRIIWSHWDSETVPEDIQEMINVTKKSLINFTHCVLVPDIISKFVDINNLPSSFYKVHRAGKSDYFRIYLLEKYGGVYVDSSTYITSGERMEWFFFEAIKAKAPAVGFEIEKRWFLVCTNFFGACEGSFFMKRFKKEQDTAMKNNPKMYVKDTCGKLRSLRVVNPMRCNNYFLIDVLFAAVTYNNKTMRDAVLQLPAEYSNFRLCIECNCMNSRDKKCMRGRLLHDPVARTYPFIKVSNRFRNGTRFHIGDNDYDLSTPDMENEWKESVKL